MTPKQAALNPLAAPGALGYLLICLFALLLITLQEMERGFTFLTPLPLLAGGIGLAIRSPLASLMLLFALGGKILLEHQTGIGGMAWRLRATENRVNLSDLILCAAVLAYVMAHYRLMGLVKNVFPADPRRRDERRGRSGFGGPIGEVYQKRSARLVGPVEWTFFALALPLWPLLAQVLWMLRPLPWYRSYLPVWLWSWTALIVPLWIVTAGLWVGSSLLKYWRARAMTAEEGLLLLQDTLWHETRREQRWVNRWLARDELQHQRKSG